MKNIWRLLIDILILNFQITKQIFLTYEVTRFFFFLNRKIISLVFLFTFTIKNAYM